MFNLVAIKENDLTNPQKKEVSDLQKRCFPDVSDEEATEDFFVVPITRILLYNAKQELVGCSGVYKTEVDYEGKRINLGGFGGVCVEENLRGRGLGKMIYEAAKKVLLDEKCDVVALSIDVNKTTDKFYEKMGFYPLKRNFSWTNSKGELKEDAGLMVAPMNSGEIFEHVLNGKTPFYVGNGYW